MNKKWKPKCGDKVWSVMEEIYDLKLIIYWDYWETHSKISDYCFGVYKTKREAQIALKKLKKFIKEEF